MDNSDQLAVEAVDLFLALIGAEAGHMGLRSLASGGIYICGGIMPKVMPTVSLMQQALASSVTHMHAACVSHVACMCVSAARCILWGAGFFLTLLS